MDRYRSEHFGDICMGPLDNTYILLYVHIYLLKHALGIYNYHPALTMLNVVLTGAYKTSLVAILRFIHPLPKRHCPFHASWTSILRTTSRKPQHLHKTLEDFLLFCFFGFLILSTGWARSN